MTHREDKPNPRRAWRSESTKQETPKSSANAHRTGGPKGSQQGRSLMKWRAFRLPLRRHAA
jgi:hypothetical protein